MWQFGAIRTSAAAALVAATSLWGCFSAGLALVGSGRAGPLVALGAAIPLLVIAAIGGGSPWREFSSHPRTFLRLGVLEAMNISLYAAALAIGPAPVVVALHLASPLLLLLLAVRAGERPMSVGVAVEFLLLIIAIMLVAARPGTEVRTGSAVLACVLALGSAAAVTALIILVTGESRQRDPAMSAGLQLAVAGLLTTPLLLSVTWNGTRMLAELALGAALLGPGFALYWRAVRHLQPATVGAVGLTEAIVASGLVGVLDRSHISIPFVVSGILVAAAILLDIQDQVR
ncbi:hypothetical protein [Nocardia asiatica]|uniref:hypothetical protein n=1 Tax=Nocardia asiatica TaxID=209252 RepID=UPI002457DDB8|nr:hypothetical protein [Nocardia asiatica]